MFVGEHDGLHQIARDDPQRSKIEQETPETNANRVRCAAGDAKRPGKISPTDKRKNVCDKQECPGRGQQAPVFRLVAQVGERIAAVLALGGLPHQIGDDGRR